MKIGVFLLDAVVTGTTTLAYELADGLRAVGHDVTTLTATRSGKQSVRWTRPDGGARWWTRAPDVTVSVTDVIELLDTFDHVIVNDVASSTLDNESENRLPVYVVGLLWTKTPWTMIAHGNSYDQKHAPHFRHLVEESHAFSNMLLGCPAPYVYDEHDLFADLAVAMIKRPYAPRFELDGPTSVRRTVGTAGRFSNGKNMHLVGLATPYMVTPLVDVELWGACQNSMRPTDAYLVYEQLAARDDVSAVSEPEQRNRSSRWDVWFESKRCVSYCGPYTDAAEVMLRFRAFVNATDTSFSSGTEYTTMEAIDAGCMILAQPQMIDWDSQLEYGRLAPIYAPRLPKSAVKHVDTLTTLAERMDAALALGEDMRQRLAAYNRRTLRIEHDPQEIARTVVEAIS